ncbi:MAG: hypothetical protein HYU66_01080, partial [Armatimonadetes bacterium]|nr:hypothetical protein [Armatimonadota bacterium]
MATERRTACIALLVLGLWIGVGRSAGAPALLDQKGQLGEASGKLDSGEFFEPFTLKVKAGQVIGARVVADGFTPYLIASLEEAARLDVEGHGDDAMFLLVAPADGELRLVVTTDKAGEKGSFQVTVTDGYVEGRLAAGDGKLESGELNDLIPAWLPVGARLTATCTSTEFDAYLLYHAGDNKAEVDDTVGLGTDAQIVVAGDPPGAQELRVTTHKPGESGAYRIQVATGEPAPVATASSTARLGKGDPTLPTGEFFHSYGFYAVAGQAYTIAAQSKQVDTYLTLKEAGGARHENDDHQGQTDAQIVFEAASTGQARIVVTSSKVGEEGTYSLVVSAGGAGATRTLLAEHGALDQNDQKMDSGELYDRYEVDVPADRRVTVRAESKAFDTYVILEVPGATEQVDNDDEKPDESNSRVTVTPTKAGKMAVYVTSKRVDQTGDYSLSVVLEAREAAQETPAGVLALGGSVDGSLAAGDAALESGEFYDKYTLTGRAGQSVKVTATSRAFDTYLIVQQPGGRNLDNDDLEGLDHASQVTFEFPEDGDATVVVTSAQKGES